MNLRTRCLTSMFTIGLAGCGGGSGPSSSATQTVLDNYATNLFAAYSDTVTDEVAFKATVETFLAAPTEANLAVARTAWLASRAHYMLVEGARFYDGPIDLDPPNHEAAVNSWPLDEAYLDYTTTDGVIDDTSGIINNPSELPTIDVAGMDALNGKLSDSNISDGYHAIEFLLWGQALAAVGPGTRPATDYQPGGPRPNVDRRSQYLRTAVDGVIQHLTAVRDAWAPGATYRTTFTSGGKASLGLILTGLGKMSKGELAGQRLDAPYQSKSRRDQHDCFSSETLTDYTRDAQGILDMYQGHYGTNTTGPGISTLVAAADSAANDKLVATLQRSIDLMKAIPAPFEASIVGADDAVGRTSIKAVVTSLRAQGDQLATAASSLGLSIVIPDAN
ncbi:MAG: imelysin family protein [Polyangia bacterium]